MSCKLVHVEIGLSGKLRRTVQMTDMIEAYAARRSLARALERFKPKAVVLSAVTASLLQPRSFWSSFRTGVRFDSPSLLNRPGLANALQHRLERRSLSRADLLLPWGEAAAEACKRGRAVTSGQDRMVALPVPIEMTSSGSEREPTVLAYAGYPRKRGLDLLCSAWSRIDRKDVRLTVAGVDRQKALAWLEKRRVPEPAGVEWAGVLPHEQFMSVMAKARLFVNASRWEDHGISQLEALASGALLVTVPSPGANEALPLARRLAERLVAKDMSVTALASALQAGLDFQEEEVTAYRDGAARLTEPLRPENVRAKLRQQVLPRLIRGL